jgi:hypothetical protein
MPNFNLMPNYIPPAETLNALPIQQPFTYTPPPPPSYIAPAPSLEEMYANMQPYMQKDSTHAADALPYDRDFLPNIAVLENQLDHRFDSAVARRQHYWDTGSDAMWLPRLMGAY